MYNNNIFINLIRFYFEKSKKEEKRNLYFSTLTFPPKVQSLTLEQKLTLVREFLKQLKAKQKVEFTGGNTFDYFWVKEGGEYENVHFHIVTNWNYSYKSITHIWNTKLRIDVSTPSTKTEEIKSLEKVLFYITKEDVKFIGLSKNLRLFITSLMNRLYNSGKHIESLSDFETLEKLLKKKVKKYKEGTTEEQKIKEQLMFDKFLKKDKAIVSEWLYKLGLNLNTEKKSFLESLKKAVEKKGKKTEVLSYYMDAITKQKYGCDLLWTSILFFFLNLTSCGEFNIKMQINLFYQKLFMLLVNNLNLYSSRRNNIFLQNDVILNDVHSEGSEAFVDFFLKEENQYRLSMVMLTYIEQYLGEYFNIKVYVEELKDSSIYIKIGLTKKYVDIKVEEEYYVAKGWNPLVVEPRDWKI